METNFSTVMTQQERMATSFQVDGFNKAIKAQETQNKDLGKNEFLQILITQLANQDPTSPMEDKEFISQMAQFSSLEQVTNMSEQFKVLAETLSGTYEVGVLGKTVTVDTMVGKERAQITGVVDAVRGGANPEILVNGQYYSYNAINTIYKGGSQL